MFYPPELVQLLERLVEAIEDLSDNLEVLNGKKPDEQSGTDGTVERTE